MGNIQTLNKSETEAPSTLSSLKEIFLQKEAKIVAIHPEATVSEAVDLMIEQKTGSVLVMEEERL